MKKYIKTKWRKINLNNLMIFNRISITISGTLLFLVWLMFLTNNFYPKSDDNLAAIIMKWPIQISIWPVTLIILFIYIMPIWVTKNNEILAIFLLLSLFSLLLSLIFLFFLNISSLWILWLIIDIIAFFNIIFTLFSIHSFNKKNFKK